MDIYFTCPALDWDDDVVLPSRQWVPRIGEHIMFGEVFSIEGTVARLEVVDVVYYIRDPERYRDIAYITLRPFSSEEAPARGKSGT